MGTLAFSSLLILRLPHLRLQLHNRLHIKRMGKSNGIGYLRLSLASLRADEGQTPDSRNPKRFASSDHIQDAGSRPHLMGGKENSNSNGIGPEGVTTSLQREADDPVIAEGLPKPALVLQATVNSVNDILVARRTLTTLNEKLEGIRQLISNSHDVNDLLQLFAVLEGRHSGDERTLKSVE